MDGLWLVVIVLAVLLATVGVWIAITYNALVTLRNRVDNGWSQIDVQLRQRADLIPNLVATVRGYASHESQVFSHVAEARAQVVGASRDSAADAARRSVAERGLSRALLELRATAEAYPQLQANENYMALQSQLSRIEDKIAYSRQFYNDVVLKLNTRIQTFPSNIVAAMFRFATAQYFETDSGSRLAPQVGL